MGLVTAAVKAGIGYPNPGWAPPAGMTGRSITGMLITSDTAMTIGAFHAGVRLIAEDIASLPLILYRRLADNGKERATEHPSYEMLHDAANPDMTAMVWRETMVGHLLTWGNCYSEKELNGLGQVVRLWPLRPDRMTVERDRVTDARTFKYRLPAGEQVILPPERVFHVPGFGFDGLVGYSRISMARRSLENAIAVEEYGLHTFANGANPGAVIKHPGQLSTQGKKNLRDSWDEQHKGLSNAQRTAVLDEGMDIKDVGFSPEDAQFLASKQHTTEDIARWLRLSPHKLSDLSRATFSNIEESNIDHVVSTLRPIAKRIEQQVGKDVVPDPRYFTEHLFDALLVGKTLERYQAYHLARMDGWMNADTIRGFENMNPLPNGEGQTYIVPLNMTPSDLLAQAVMDGAASSAKDASLDRETQSRTGEQLALVLAAIADRPDPVAAPVNVTIAEGAVRADISTPVSIAEGAVQVDVTPAPVTVTTPAVTVEAPAAAPAPKSRKTVERDDAGRITAITEEPA